MYWTDNDYPPDFREKEHILLIIIIKIHLCSSQIVRLMSKAVADDAILSPSGLSLLVLLDLRL